MTQYSENYKWLLEEFDTVMASHQDLGKAVREAGPIQLAATCVLVLIAIFFARFSWVLPDGEEPTPLTSGTLGSYAVRDLVGIIDAAPNGINSSNLTPIAGIAASQSKGKTCWIFMVGNSAGSAVAKLLCR